jgi:F-type H+-transporting ATPase subunit b
VNINVTLIGQMLTFLILVSVTMKYIWPPVIRALENRRKQIAEGLEAAERGRHELELAHQKVKDQLRDARTQATHIVDQANIRASRIIEDAKERAKEEGDKLIALAREQIEQEVQTARQTLLKQVATLAISGVEKILQQKVDESANSSLVDQLIAEI